MRNLQLYVRSMGKLLRVERVFPSTLEGQDEANAAMERDARLAVVADCEGMILLADKYDQGEPLPKDWA